MGTDESLVLIVVHVACAESSELPPRSAMPNQEDSEMILVALSLFTCLSYVYAYQIDTHVYIRVRGGNGLLNALGVIGIRISIFVIVMIVCAAR